ncbi:MAG: biopolymer transporter ExbD [Chitinispirillales bacterium]|jgi:biopolymer transport protein ExbD|nr:biopolymer transporter ExbD [Chitinispirillales bacterium]
MRGLSLFKSSRPPSDMAKADVDVTPVMNVFVILIPFLVSMAVFTQVSIIEFSVPSDVGQSSGQSSDKPRLRLTVLLTESFLAVTEGERMLDSLPLLDNGQYPFDSLKQALSLRRPQSDFSDEVIVAVRDRVAFRHVVRAMDVSRESGFTKIGISGAADDPAQGR